VLTAANVAAVPTLIRDQLTRFSPDLATSTGLSGSSKVAAVALGVGIGAAGVEFPRHHARTHRAPHESRHATHLARPRPDLDRAATPVMKTPSVAPRADDHRGERNKRSTFAPDRSDDVGPGNETATSPDVQPPNGGTSMGLTEDRSGDGASPSGGNSGRGGDTRDSGGGGSEDGVDGVGEG
jgi:hypothetical protein